MTPLTPGQAPSNPCLILDPVARHDRVAQNTIRQYDEIVRLAGEANGTLNVTPQLLQGLQQIAIEGIYVCAGQFRQWPIYIRGVPHQPPPWQDVPALVDDMCAYANNPVNGTALHTAAYLLWRLN